MTTYYVKHTGTKATAGAGNDWTGALSGVYPKIADVFSLNTLAAGDEIRVSDAHSQTALGATQTLGVSGPTRQDPLRILCVQDGSPGTLSDYTASSGGVEATTSSFDYRIDGNIFMHGLNLKGGRCMWLNSTAGRRLIASKCKFEALGNDFACYFLHGDGSGGGAHYDSILYDCILRWAGSAPIGFRAGGRSLKMFGGQLTSVNAIDGQSLFVGNWYDGTHYGRFSFIGVDMSGLSFGSNPLLPAANGLFLCELVGCRIPTISTHAAINAAPAPFAQAHDGLVTDGSNYARRENDWNGRLVEETSIYRSGGWTDGVRTNPISYKITVPASTPAITKKQYVGARFLIGAMYVAAGTKTVDLYVACADALDAGHVWIDVLAPNASDNSAKMDLATTRVAPLTSPGALTTGGTWTSSPGNAYKLSKSVTLNKAGIILVYLNYAPEATVDKVLYVDPAFDVT